MIYWICNRGDFKSILPDVGDVAIALYARRYAYTYTDDDVWVRDKAVEKEVGKVLEEMDAAWKDAPGNTEGEETYYPTRPKRSRKPANKKK